MSQIILDWLKGLILSIPEDIIKNCILSLFGGVFLGFAEELALSIKSLRNVY